MAPKLGDRNAPPFELANVHVLEAAAADLLDLRQLLRRDLPVVQAQAAQVQLELGLRLAVVLIERGRARLVEVHTLGAQEDRRGSLRVRAA